MPFAKVLSAHRPELEPYALLYRHFHQNPELSTLEVETAAKIAEHLRALSPELQVRTGIGGTGLIAIYENGPGPTVLLRADMDGLPILERTGLDYASTKTMCDTHTDSLVKPTMHACGHDFHITCALAAAETMVRSKAEWSGTAVFLFQPAEERACGASMMIEDGLYDPERHACPIPDVVLGQHVFPVKAGTVVTKPGAIMSAADSWRITVYGTGGHASMPHRCVDPVVIASHIVVRLQTLVSREVPPDQQTVLTVGSVSAGDTVNVIADKAVLQVNVRSVSEEWRKVVLDGIKRIVKAECMAGRSPKEPVFEEINNFPLTENDADVTATLQKSFTRYFGDRHTTQAQPLAASEDFSKLATAVGKPYAFWFWGGVDVATWEAHEAAGTLNDVPVNHSAFFAPAIHPTLETGIDAMVVAALTYLGKDGVPV
jgi:amidohydrolase